MGVWISANPDERRPSVRQQVHAVMVEQDAPLFVAAVTRDVAARADLARRLPGESVLLLFPDYATAARTLSEGDLGAGPHLGTSAPFGADPPGDDGPAGTAADGGLFIDPLRLDVTWNGMPLRLTRLERAVLGHLAQAPLRAWAYADLYRAAWGDAWLGDTSALHATVKRLRRKLRDAGVTIFLESIRGVGFRLDAQGNGVAVAHVAATESALG